MGLAHPALPTWGNNVTRSPKFRSHEYIDRAFDPWTWPELSEAGLVDAFCPL